jgi:hypothetical protein
MLWRAPHPRPVITIMIYPICALLLPVLHHTGGIIIRVTTKKQVPIPQHIQKNFETGS